MDPNTNQANAPEEVWQEFYSKNVKYKAIRKDGCEHYEIFGELFNGTIARGGLATASTRLPATSDEEKQAEDAFLSGGVHVEKAHGDNEDDEDPTPKRKTVVARNARRQKKAKVSIIDKLESCIDKWYATVSQRSEESRSRQKYFDAKVAYYETLKANSQAHGSDATSPLDDLHSLDICLDILNEMGEKLSNDVYSKATKAFQDAGLRRTFLKVPEKRKLPWLERL